MSGKTHPEIMITGKTHPVIMITGKPCTTDIPFRNWPLRARLIERLYRLTHHGQIRTLVIRRNRATR